MNGKKSGGFNSLVLAVIVLLVVFSVVKISGGTATGAGSSGIQAENIGPMSAGTYTAEATGFSSDVSVTITVDEDGVITEVVIDATGETESIGGVAATQLETLIVDLQSTAFDTVSGASYTTDAVRTALSSCMHQAAGE